MTLYTYTVCVDGGSAPNPYWGICTLAICKPKIRRLAQPGDWVVGLGSKNVDGVDYSGRVVYAMRVHESLMFEVYDQLCRTQLKGKIPDMTHRDFRRQLGDCIYDFRGRAEALMRDGVHDEGNRERDLSGKNVLLSDYFFYFGREAVKLPKRLLPILNQHPGNKSKMNDPYKHEFVDWIEKNYKPNVLYGRPQMSEERCERKPKPKCLSFLSPISDPFLLVAEFRLWLSSLLAKI